MPGTATILIYGHDPRLLATRCMILEKAGFTVMTAESFVEIDLTAKFCQIKLLILCHTLSLGEFSHALAFGHSRWPAMRSLVLNAAGARSSRGLVVDQELDAMDGPGELVFTAGRLIGRAAPAKPRLSANLNGDPNGTVRRHSEMV